MRKRGVEGVFAHYGEYLVHMHMMNSIGSHSSRESESTTTTTESTGDEKVFREQNGHIWYQKFLKRPTWCDICTKFIYGITLEQQHAFKCGHCKLIAHHDCLLKMTVQCRNCVADSHDDGNSKKAADLADIVMEVGQGFTTRDALNQTGQVSYL